MAVKFRHMTQLTPSIPVQLIMPSSELHFSVDNLSQLLSKKANVSIERSKYLHGFYEQAI